MDFLYRDPEEFQRVADALLSTHYGISTDDTDLCDLQRIELHIANRDRPFEVINEIADRNDLVRMDVEGFYGVPANTPLTSADEDTQRGILRLPCAVERYRQEQEAAAQPEDEASSMTP